MSNLKPMSLRISILAGSLSLAATFTAAASELPAALPTSDTPDFGPDVQIFDPAEPAANIQAAITAAFNSELLSPTAQFGNQRFVFLFKPGTYNGPLFANLGFYTTIAGLGLKQAAAAKILHLSQPQVSDLLRGRLHLFSTGTIIKLLISLGVRVRFVVD